MIAKSNNNEIAIQDGNKTYTYKSIFQDSRKLAKYLSTLGMKKGDTAVIASQPGYEFLLILYATIMLRVKLTIIDPQLGNDLYQAKLKELNPEWAFIDSKLLLLQEHPILRRMYLRSGKNKVYFPYSNQYQTIATGPWMPLMKSFQRLGLYNIHEPMNFDPTFTDYEYIVTYTSGTTSEPKGVVHRLSTITTSVKHITKLLGSTKGKSLATHLPHLMLIAVSSGLKVQLWKEEWSAEKKIDFIIKNEISILFGPPTDYIELINYCKESNRKLPNCIEHIIIDSAPKHSSFHEDLFQHSNSDTSVTMMLGMTELLSDSIVDDLDYKFQGDVLNESSRSVNLHFDQEGEIKIQFPQLHKKCLQLPNGNDSQENESLKYIIEEGKSINIQRKKDLIIQKNYNLYPALHEPTIKSIPGIIEAVLVSKYIDEIVDEKIYLIIESEKNLSRTKIMSQLANGEYRIDREALPDEILFAKIPRKGRQQKIDRKASIESII